MCSYESYYNCTLCTGWNCSEHISQLGQLMQNSKNVREAGLVVNATRRWFFSYKLDKSILFCVTTGWLKVRVTQTALQSVTMESVVSNSKRAAWECFFGRRQFAVKLQFHKWSGTHEWFFFEPLYGVLILQNALLHTVLMFSLGVTCFFSGVGTLINIKWIKVLRFVCRGMFLLSVISCNLFQMITHQEINCTCTRLCRVACVHTYKPAQNELSYGFWDVLRVCPTSLSHECSTWCSLQSLYVCIFRQ